MESLVVAERAGVGVRVVIDGRQGFAWAGSLDAAVVDEALTEARDNAGFATPDTCIGIATPADAAGPVPSLDLWRADVTGTPTADKVALALAAEAATRADDDRVRTVESAEYGDAATETAIATSTGIEAQAARTTCSVAAFALAGEGVDTRTGYGFSAGRSFADLDVDVAAADAAQRAVRLLGADAAAHPAAPGGARSARHALARRDHRRRRSAGRRSSRAARCSSGTSASRSARTNVTLVDDPDRRRRVRRVDARRRGRADAAASS